MTDRYQSLFIAALIVLAAGILLALIRAIRGPRVADRIMGINMIGTMSTACIAILSVLLRQSWLLDVGLIYCMISFLAVVVLVKNHIAAHREEDRDV
ncbi:MAG: sodium:proton antiporter [Oscillospiraceae bacterium]|nr:sodium:proton antiporter [Oscillospiraceae bacterium]